MKSLKIDTRWAKRLQSYTDAEKGRLIQAVLDYALTEVMPDISGREIGAFLMLAESVAEQIQSSSSRSEINRQNVSKRYLQNATNSTNRNESYQIVTNRSEEEKEEKASSPLPPTPPITPTSKEKKEKERSTLKGTKKERPTEEQIAEYVKEKNLSVDPHEFFTYFTEGNWVDSKGQPVRNWKQKLLTWERFQNTRPRKATGASAHYKQTPLSDEDFAGMFVDLAHDII